MIPERGPQTVFWGSNLCYAICAMQSMLRIFAMQYLLCNLCYAIYAKRNMLKNIFGEIQIWITKKQKNAIRILIAPGDYTPNSEDLKLNKKMQ